MAALLAASNPLATQLCDFDQSPNSPAMILTGSSGIQSRNDDENLLKFFTTRMVHLFPFVIVSTDISAQQLRQERPFFFLCLSMVACQKASRQREMSTTIQKYVAEHIILRNERSLDLLQGLLVFLAWFIGHSPVPVQAEGAFGGINSRQAGQGPAQLDVFMQLALAQLTSLRLGHGLSSLNRSSKPISYVGRMDKLVDSRQLHTLEERRAYLGCYYLTVMYAASSFFSFY